MILNPTKGARSMEFRKEDMLDLNEQNVQRIFSDCLANDKTDPSNVLEKNFFGRYVPGNIPKMKFDKEKLHGYSKSIIYMICQLKSIHERKAELGLMDGFRKYDGTNWTQNKIALFALYYLATTTSFFPEFEYLPISKEFSSCIANFQFYLKPTLSPNDPNFK